MFFFNNLFLSFTREIKQEMELYKRIENALDLTVRKCLLEYNKQRYLICEYISLKNINIYFIVPYARNKIIILYYIQVRNA